jgi:exonuclease SbcC
VTAFGPFCETQVVDFDLLNEAGVFLLTGDTGAGKTSILDAICFGLYGQVPGMRDKAKAYRSHHAAADVPPRVVLEVTLRGRRLRLTRQAPWLRPSRRARKGYVDEPARALAEERRHGQWVTVSTRVDEVGHLVSTWLGLNRDQFCQVVMLPQGDFQAFLRSGARERQSILETLFGTQRFQAVERWLADHRRQQARTCRDLEAQGSRLLARLSEACSPPIVGLPVEPAALAVDAATFMSDVRQIVETAGVEMRSARLASDAAETLAKERVHALDSARAVAERREKYREAQRQHAALLAMHEVTTAREIRLRRARLAAPLYPHVALTREADEAAARADADAAALLDDWDLARDEWGIEGDVPTSPAQAGGVVASLRERLARLAELASDALEIESLADRVRVESERRFALAASIAANRERLLATPARRAELQTLLARAAATVQSGPDAAVRHAEGLRILAAAEEAESHSARLGELDTALLAAREAAVTVTEQWLDARTRLLAGVAAELAAGLVDGEGCPVCGSSLHPEPAQPLAQHVSAEEENALLHRVESLRADVSRSETARSAIVSAHTDAMIRSRGLDVAAAQALVAVAEAEQAEAIAAVPERDSLQAAIESLVKADETQRHAVEEATADLARRGADHRVEPPPAAAQRPRHGRGRRRRPAARCHGRHSGAPRPGDSSREGTSLSRRGAP